MKIYTRKGDGGETSLFGGRRVDKDDIRVAAYGTVDELNSVLGMVIAGLPGDLAAWQPRLISIQHDCFVVGAILATPALGDARPAHIPSLAESRVEELEDWIDALVEELDPLQAFILPGGSDSAAALHLARSVCRRAERCVVTLDRHVKLEPIVIRYLNRLSDLLFTLARCANARLEVADVEWHPDEA